MAIKLLALVCLAGAALAGPLQREVESQCATSCPLTADGKFQYQPGNRYVYRYKGFDYVSVAGGRKELKSQIAAEVQIDVLGRCEMSLQISDFHYQGEQPLSPDIEEQLSIPLRFSWVDGKIENICSSSDESQESENIKRGILSAIVNTMYDLRSASQHRELDSLGSCETKYTVIRVDGDKVTIKKEKSLKSCDNRHSGLTAFPYNPYQSPQSNIQGLPIFTHEKSECEQEIDNQVIKRALCRASAQIQPLSKYDNLVQFQGEVQLELQGVQRSASSLTSQISSQQISQMNKKSIRYNYEQQQDVETREREAREILSKLCSKSNGLLHPSVSKHYMHLITVLKGLPEDSVRSLYQSLKSQELCSSPKVLDIFLDALPMTGTEGAIKLMVELLKTKQVSGLKAKMWPASFALIPSPKAEAVSAILPLVSSEEKSRPILLGLSAMIYKLCSNNDCDQIKSVRDAVLTLQHSLGSQCSSYHDEEVISILKAFGNMGYHGQAKETILACARSSKKSVPVRLAAIEAFRRCTEKIPPSLVELYSSESEHFEVRIAALTTAVSCEDSRVPSAIQSVLDNDKDEQVVAYTLSLLKNLQETSSPLKQSIKHSLQHIKTNRTVGYWENSKNIEWSAFNVPTNLGASLESNIIHSHGSKIPRSLSSKIDIDIFGKNVNIFEFGTRAEGLENAARKLFRMPKSSTQKKSWFSLTRSTEKEEERSEFSFYARTFGTEFFDMTVSDFTSVSKMVELADVVNKISKSKTADFSHSFLFLNTKVIIPSVTGRSYAFGMTGSATVGLTANGKLDFVHLMSSPRNCDIGGHIQPSANVEITTTLGVHSEKSRPDIKIVTSFHSEADFGAKLRVKDSHMAEARLDLPSESVQLLKVSTELFEIDANDNETPIIEEMQQKIDHCISALEKPLGLQLCGKFETPRPFVSRNFPYARGLGNLELAINKVDRSMTGYVISFEMPKRQTNYMSYRLIMDTPGSSVNRKFQAHLNLDRKSSGELEFKLNAQCPFKEILASGSYTWRSDLVKAVVKTITDKTHLYSLKAAVEMSQSNTEMTFKPTLQWILPASEPVNVVGSIIYSNLRKMQLIFELSSIKASGTPYILTGNFMKDGTFGLTKQDQWKMSADLFTKTPFITTKVHSTVDKKSGQTHSIASSISVDYETQKSKKQSVKILSKLQQSSLKVSASTQFETTQFPKYNCILSWDMQGSPKDSLKNDIMLRYGKNPERSYVQISQTFQLRGQNSLSEGKISVKAPQFSVDSELKVAVGLRMQETGIFHIESDLRYKEQRHAKCLIQLKQLSKSPVKMAIKAQVQYPGFNMLYRDEIIETSQNIFQGHSVFQWKSNQQASLRYRYKKLSDDSTFHHEIETTLIAPFIRSQIVNQASLKATKEDMEIHAQLQGIRQVSYKLDAQLKKTGQSRISISSPIMEGQIEVSNESEKKSSAIDIALKTRNPQRFVASTMLNLGTQKRLQTEISWNSETNPSQKVLFAANVEATSQKSYRAHSQVQVLDYIKVDASCSCEKDNQIAMQSKIDVSGRHFESFSIETHNEMNRESISSAISFKKGHSEKAVVQLSGKYAKKSKGCEMQGTVSIASPDHSFENKEFFIQHSFDRSHSSSNLQCTLRFENAPGKKFESTIEYSSEAKLSRKLRLAVETPYQRFAKQEISFSQRSEQSKHTVNAAVQCSGKELALTSVLIKTSQGGSISCSLKTPLDMAKSMILSAAFENQQSEKIIESYFELNGQKKFECSASYISEYGRQKVQSNTKLFLKSKLSLNLKAEKDKHVFSHELSITEDSSRLISYKIMHRSSDDQFTCHIEAKNSRDTFVDMQFTKETKDSVEYKLTSKKPFLPISVVLQTKKGDDNSRNIMISACRESSDRLCYTVKGDYKRESSNEKYSEQRILLNVQKVTGQESFEPLCTIQYLIAQQDRSVKSKFSFEARNKKYGYDFSINHRSNEASPREFDISFIMPSRTVQCSFSVTKSSQSSAYEFVVIPSTSTPDHKVSLELRNLNSRNNELSGQLKFSHPALIKPILAKYSISMSQSRLPEAGKFELDYSKNSKDILILELSIQSPRSQPEKKLFQCKFYSRGKELDLSLRASIHQTTHIDSYLCDWSWQSQQRKESGKLSIQLSDKKSGRPQTAEIEISCPHFQYSVVGHTEWVTSLPSKAELKFSSNARVVGEILYDRSDSCNSIEIKSSAPVLKNRICLNKSEQQKLTLLSVEWFCQDAKCLGVSFDLDPSQSHVANVGIMWKKEKISRLLETLKEFEPDFKHHSFMAIKEEVCQKIESVYSPLKKQVLKPIFAHSMEEARQLLNEQALEIRQIQKSIKSLAQRMPKLPTKVQLEQDLNRYLEWLRKDGVRYFEEHAPEWLSDLANSLLQGAERYIEDLCKRGTFCYKVKQTYRRHGMERVQKLLQAELHETFGKIEKAEIQRINAVQDWITEAWEKAKELVEKYEQDLRSLIPSLKNSAFFKKLVENIEKIRESLYNKSKEYFDELLKYIDDMIDHASKKDEFKVLLSLLQDLKSEILNIYQKFDMKKIMESLRRSGLQEYTDRWIQKKISVSDLDIKSGKVQVQVHHPFDQAKMQFLKNIFIMAKRKYQSLQKMNEEALRRIMN